MKMKRKLNLADFAIAAVFLGVIYVSVMALSDTVAKDLKLKQAESHCIGKWVEAGVERSRISKGAGTCWLKEK